MKINNMNGIMQAYNLSPKDKNTKKMDSVAQQNDRFEISQKGKEIAVGSKALAQAPEIRETKVSHIKEQITQGTYTIDPVLIAQKMLSRN